MNALQTGVFGSTDCILEYASTDDTEKPMCKVRTNGHRPVDSTGVWTDSRGEGVQDNVFRRQVVAGDNQWTSPIATPGTVPASIATHARFRGPTIYASVVRS